MAMLPKEVVYIVLLLEVLCLLHSAVGMNGLHRTNQESFGNSGRPILGAPKKKRPDMGPSIFEENEVQILTDSDWDENMMNYDIYLVLFYVSGRLE